MSLPRKFLIVDDNPDSRFLLVKTLLRKFPQAVIQETQDGESAVALTRAEPLDALIVHRAAEVDGITLIRMLRDVNSSIPIVMVSGLDRAKQAVEAGATTFLNYDAWLRIGTVVAEIVGQTAEPPATASEPDAATSRV
jgi:DNA-binding response OmpR family regulator